MNIVGPEPRAQLHCERILRSLPDWFGIESAVVKYAEATSTLPTFVARKASDAIGFISLLQHFEHSWEVHCIAVHAGNRRHGVGRALHAHAENWLRAQGAKLLQVKTLAASHPSAEYAETRAFYECVGYVPLEVFPELWSSDNPALQLVKTLEASN